MYNAVEEPVTSKINFKDSEWPSAAKDKILVEDSSQKGIFLNYYYSKDYGLYLLKDEVQQDNFESHEWDWGN